MGWMSITHTICHLLIMAHLRIYPIYPPVIILKIQQLKSLAMGSEDIEAADICCLGVIWLIFPPVNAFSNWESANHRLKQTQGGEGIWIIKLKEASGGWSALV